jgi:two-component system, NtrC family, sensor kinase
MRQFLCMTDSNSKIAIYAVGAPFPKELIVNSPCVYGGAGDVPRLVDTSEYAVIVIFGRELAQTFLTASKKSSKIKSYRLIIIDSTFSVDDVTLYSNSGLVVKILKIGAKKSPIDLDINAALEKVSLLRDSEDIITKVRVQNKVLSEINENLEDLVRQRTENLESSKLAVESKLRRIKDLIKFIKSLSQINNFDDLILLLRQEFIKFHKIRSPLLIYSLGGTEIRCISFQGPQVIDQALSIENASVFSTDTSTIREVLANALERPIGPVVPLQFVFANNRGLLLFEHSFSEEEAGLFKQILEERTEPLRVAFERLALKWHAHLISRQWSSTFDLLKDPILIVDRNYHVVRSNKTFAHHKGEQCFAVFAKRTSPCVGCPLPRAIESQAGSDGKINVQDKTFEVEAFPIVVDGIDDSSNLIVHYKDVTRSVNLQGQLIQSEKMAAIGMLAGNIAHELNNPLTGIKSLTQILLSEVAEDSPVFADLTEVRNAGDRCEQIIKNLLEFSSNESKDLILTSMKDVLNKTLPFLKTALHYFNTQIVLSEGPDAIFVDPQLLQQVIFNLINNACQAMDNSGSIFIQSEVTEETVMLRIRDTGPGVPLDLQDEIFAPFFTTKEEGKGTGLGLSVSRAIIEKFNGTLFLNKEITEGCEFVIQLPRSRDASIDH